MKNKILLVISIVALVAMAVVLTGCSCGNGNSKETTINPKNVPTDKAEGNGNGVNYVEDNFPTISPTEKTTDKNGNTVITYTNEEGNKVIKTYKKDGIVKMVIKDKNGKVIKKKEYKESTQEETKKASKKDNKKDGKKDQKESAGSVNDDNGSWSDFY